MRFLDTNILIYALLKPKRALNIQEQNMLKHSHSILTRIEQGEQTLSSVVHISEFVNIVQKRTGIEITCQMLNSLLSLKNVQIASVERNHYQVAVEIAQKTQTSINDCIAFTLMSEHKISEIYSFDKDFDHLGIKRITT